MNRNRNTRPLLEPVGETPVLLRALGRGVDWTVIAIGALMTAGVFVNVVLHQFGRDLAWVTELGELLMVWVTFLGGACAAQRGLHMGINEFVDKLGPAARLRADAVTAALCAALMGLLTVYGWRLVQANWDNQLTVLEWPMALQYMGMAVGSTLMTLFFAVDAWQASRGLSRERRYPSAHGL